LGSFTTVPDAVSQFSLAHAVSNSLSSKVVGKGKCSKHVKDGLPGVVSYTSINSINHIQNFIDSINSLLDSSHEVDNALFVEIK
jgi:hypothetical protein